MGLVSAGAAGATLTNDAPVHSAAFAAEAGYRIAVLVQGGIESAQLQLHPADMGPVTVQIVVEGQTAQVQLSALQADTRQALEASLPQLASQLRESGLTLTGGGVFEQAPQQQGASQQATSDNQDRGSRQGQADSGRGTATQPAPAPENTRTVRTAADLQRRGVVDLVA